MTDANRELELLERATSQASSPVSSGDDAELREAWTTLTQLVARADAEHAFDERAFLAKVSASVSKTSRAPRRSRLLLLGTLAATVAFFVAVAGYVAMLHWGVDNGLGQGVLELPENPEQIAQSPIAAEADKPKLDWDDTLDERLGFVSESLSGLESGSYRGDYSLHSFGLQVEQFGHEIRGGSL